MPDWTQSMQQTYEFYTVNPDTWGDEEQLTKIKSCSITRDDEDELLENASFDVDETIGERYVRVYLVTIQNGVTEKFPLCTTLVQTPEEKYDGRKKSMSLQAYSPLIEIKDTAPPYGYTVMEGADALFTVSDIVSDNARAPVVMPQASERIASSFVSDFDNDTWLSYTSDLLSSVGFKYGLDAMGRILFMKKQNPEALRPVWTYTDDNSSILYPEITMSRDLYGVPNVVEVLFSDDNGYLFARVENNDENSPTSIPSRGRRVVHRVSNPEDLINPTQTQINIYAEELLRTLSNLEYTLSYTHGYCPVRVGDCVMLDYERAGIKGVKALVTKQSISCTPGCAVTETAVFTTKLWG